jgi:hypothetical protein
MTSGGWLMLIVAVGGMTGLMVWCVYKVLSTPGSTEHLHTQPHIDTHDTP